LHFDKIPIKDDTLTPIITNNDMKIPLTSKLLMKRQETIIPMVIVMTDIMDENRHITFAIFVLYVNVRVRSEIYYYNPLYPYYHFLSVDCPYLSHKT